MNKIIKNILLFILSYFTLTSVIYIGDLENNKFAYIILFIIFILFIFLFRKFLNLNILKKDKNLFILFMLFSIFVAITFVIGYNLTKYDDSYINRFITYYHIFNISNLAYALLNLIYEKKKYLNILENKNVEWINKILFEKHTFIKVMILILVAWIPILLAFYPGIFSYDSSAQIKEYFTNNLSNANPLIHTLIIGKFLFIGHDIFKSYNIGVLIYSIFQMLVLSSTLSYVITYINKRKLPFIYKMICLLIFMFLPTHSVMSLVATKDIIFSCLVVLTSVMVYDMIIYQNEFFGKYKIRNIVLYIICATLMMMFKHNGLYGYVFMGIFLIVLLRKRLLLVLICFVVPIIIYLGYIKGINNYVLSSSDSISTSTASATLFVPVQQLSRVYNYAPLTVDEQEELAYFGRENGLSIYEVRKSDGALFNFNMRKVNENKILFVKTYFKYLGKYPKLYIDAFLQNILGFFYIDDILPDNTTYRTYIEIRSRDDYNNTNDEIKFESKLPSIYTKYYNMLEEGEYQYYPILHLLMSNAFYNILMIFVICLLLLRKQYKEMVPYMLLVGIMITYILGPVALLRYCYYLYIIFPIMILSLYSVRKKY
ncbi:MAG: hypothetical protein IJ565_02870 [Bacilli bacterium]|nr:hypothetical protein [Bacilli bacterium]